MASRSGSRVPPVGRQRGRPNPLVAASRPARPLTRRGRWLTYGALGVMVGTVLVVSVALVTLYGLSAIGDLNDYFTRQLPPVDQVFSKSEFQSALIYDRKGRLLYELFDPQGGRRTLVQLKDIPPALIDATLSTEDSNFYSNPGIDPVAIVRAIGQNILHHQIESGASTITQQLVRNVLMTPAEAQSRSAGRKIEEAILAYRVSQTYSKDDILERYLNEIYYSNHSYGVEAASEVYFNKPVRQLTLSEAALIAGLPQAPSTYDPYQNPAAAKARQLEVLSLMVKHGYITQDQADAAAAEPLDYHSAPEQMQAPHFVVYVRNLLEQRFSREQLYNSGLRIYTSLDLDLQHDAEKIAQTRLAALHQYNANNAALVAIDPKTGEILAMLGSENFFNDSIQGQINMALAERQPGSTLKPFNYLYAFQHHLASPASILNDSPVQYSMGPGKAPYLPHDSDGKFRGPVTVRDALANSLNVPAVQMLNQIGVGALIGTLHDFGITSLQDTPEHYGLSLTLGGGPVKLLDLTFAYAALANGGVQIGEPVTNATPGASAYEPVAILKVTDQTGKVLANYQPPGGARLMGEQATWLITDILADDAARVPTYGAHSYLELDRPAAVKTGTTEQFQDSWTIGYTPQLVVGVWVGNASDKPMDNVFDARGAGFIWHEFMVTALQGQPALPFTRPPGLVRATVDAQTGLQPVPGRPSVTDWFIQGVVPTNSAPAPTPVAQPPTPTVPPSAPTAIEMPTQLPAPTATVTPPPAPAAAPTAVPKPGPVPAVGNPNLVIVPNLAGLPEADAQALINESALATSYVNYQTINDVPDKSYFQSVPVGGVLSQLPLPGQAVPKGTKVYIAVRKQ